MGPTAAMARAAARRTQAIPVRGTTSGLIATTHATRQRGIAPPATRAARHATTACSATALTAATDQAAALRTLVIRAPDKTPDRIVMTRATRRRTTVRRAMRSA